MFTGCTHMFFHTFTMSHLLSLPFEMHPLTALCSYAHVLGRTVRKDASHANSRGTRACLYLTIVELQYHKMRPTSRNYMQARTRRTSITHTYIYIYIYIYTCARLVWRCTGMDMYTHIPGCLRIPHPRPTTHTHIHTPYLFWGPCSGTLYAKVLTTDL
jgi:hypothetical protein